LTATPSICDFLPRLSCLQHHDYVTHLHNTRKSGNNDAADFFSLTNPKSRAGINKSSSLSPRGYRGPSCWYHISLIAVPLSSIAQQCYRCHRCEASYPLGCRFSHFRGTPIPDPYVSLCLSCADKYDDMGERPAVFATV